MAVQRRSVTRSQETPIQVSVDNLLVRFIGLKKKKNKFICKYYVYNDHIVLYGFRKRQAQLSSVAVHTNRKTTEGEHKQSIYFSIDIKTVKTKLQQKKTIPFAIDCHYLKIYRKKHFLYSHGCSYFNLHLSYSLTMRRGHIMFCS